jgi:hypothetical protein
VERRSLKMCITPSAVGIDSSMLPAAENGQSLSVGAISIQQHRKRPVTPLPVVQWTTATRRLSGVSQLHDRQNRFKGAVRADHVGEMGESSHAIHTGALLRRSGQARGMGAQSGRHTDEVRHDS